MRNCFNCSYGKILENGDILCQGKYTIKKEKANIACHAFKGNSDKNNDRDNIIDSKDTEELFKQILEETDKKKRQLLVECILQEEDIQREITQFKKDWMDTHPYIYIHDDGIEKAILDVARLLKKPKKGEVRSPKGYFINHVFRKKKFGNGEDSVYKSYLEVYLEKYKEKYGIFNSISAELVEMKEMNDISDTWDDERMQWQTEAIAERHQRYYRDSRTDFSIPDVETATTENDGILEEIEKENQEDIEPMIDEEAEKIESEIKEKPDYINYFDCSLDQYRMKYFSDEQKAWEEYIKRMNKLFSKNGEYWKYADNVGMIPDNRKEGYKEVETYEYTVKKGKKSYLKVYNKKEKLKFDFSKPFTFLLYRFLTKTELEFVDLYYFQCLSLDAISEKMKIEKSTVQNLKSATKIKIKNILQSFDVICTPDETLAYWFRKINTREKMQDFVYLYMEG